MTNEECIKILKSKLDGNTDTSYEWCECVRLAINALEQQTCEDAISRATLLEELGEEPFNWNDSPEAIQEVRDYQWFKSLVENAPSVIPEAKWIPVSEKLPEPLTAVLLTVRYKSTGILTYQMGYWEDALEKWEKWLEIGTLDDEFEVVAWMELPERYWEGDDYE